MSIHEEHLEGWEEIAELFPMVTSQTVRKKYGKEMLAGAWAFKSHVGRGKKPKVWSFPSLVQKFIAKKQLDNKSV